MINCTPTREGNACRGFVIGAAIAIPAYLALAWLVSRVAHIGYGLALLCTLGVGAVIGGLLFLWALRRAKEIE